MKESPFTKVPNSVFDIEGLTVYERLILLYIVRKTIGFSKKSDGISLSQFTRGTGISKNTILKSLESLKELNFIRIQKQTRKNGGKSYNRYTPLVQEVDYLVHERNKGSSREGHGLVHQEDIQKNNNTKKNKQKRERESMCDIESIYFTLYENERLKETDKYISYLIEQEGYIKNSGAFKMKVKRQLSKEDEFQLEDFEKWYLEKECATLKEKYIGKYLEGDQISSIYPYFYTENYDPNDKFILWFNKDEKDFSFYKCFSSKAEIEEFLEEIEI